MNTCDEIRPSLEAYALEALDSDEEMSKLQKHLQNCPDCRALLDSYRPVTDLLALEAGHWQTTDFEPPAGHQERFRAKLAQRVQQISPSQAPVQTQAQAQATPEPALIKPLEMTRRKSNQGRVWPRRGIAGLLAAMLLLSVGLGSWAVNLQDNLNRQSQQSQALLDQARQRESSLNQQISQLNNQLSQNQQTTTQQVNALTGQRDNLQQELDQLKTGLGQQSQVAQNVSLLLTSPGATTRSVAASDSQLKLTVLMAPSEKQAALVMQALPNQPTNQEYHVWLYDTNGQLVSAGPARLLSLDGATGPLSLAVIQVPQPMANYTTLWITLEKPGVQTPSGPELIRDKLA